MIGLALVTLVATLAAGFRASNRSADEDAVRADYVVTSKSGFDTIPADVGDGRRARPRGAGGLRRAPRRGEGVRAGRQRRRHRAELREQRPTSASSRAPPRSSRGWDRRGDRHEGLRRRPLAARSAARVRSPRRRAAPVDGAGRRDHEPEGELTGDVLISQAAFDARFPRPERPLRVRPHGRAGRARPRRPAIDRAVSRFPEVDARTRAAWIDFRGQDMQQFLMLLYVLLALSVVVSLFGMVNALVLTVFERTREIGMMRAVGMTRRQVRRMVRHESIITALIGAGLGCRWGCWWPRRWRPRCTRPFVPPVAVARASSRSSRSSPACWRRSARRGGRRSSTCCRRCTTSRTAALHPPTPDAVRGAVGRRPTAAPARPSSR